MRIRQGNDFIFLWAIERNGLPEDFSNAVNIRLHFKNFDCVGEVKSFQIVDGNIVRVEVSPEWASNLGAYRLILSYEFEDLSLSDGDRKCVVDVLAFNIVPKTSEADDVTEMAKTTDMMIGLKGDKGDPFTYDDFTPEQIEDLKRPAIEAAESVQIVENQISINEQGRVQAENERETAELTRQSSESERNENEGLRVNAENLRATAETSRQTAEGLRVDAELLRQTNTQTAITNAENATENANTAAQNADDARLAIQDDLALKADHGYQSNPKTLKQVEDDTSVKMTNLVVDGGFESGVPRWYSTPPILSEEEKLSGGSSGYSNLAGRVAYSMIDIVCDLNDKLYISVSRRFKTTPSYTNAPIRITDFGSLANFSNLAPLYNGNFDVWETTTFIANGRANGVRLAVGFFSAVTVQYFVDNFIAVNLTETFGEGNEPTKEEFELLLDILGIDFFEGEITVPAQKVMQWQLAMIRQNRNAIIALGGTII